MSSIAYGWAPITKVEDNGDGTCTVFGPMTDAGLDRDKQRFTQEWQDQAVPQWFNESGNIREQHDGKRAAGAALVVKRDDASGRWDLAAHVVDPVAVKKCTSNPPVYKGFSIGVKDPHITYGKADTPGGEIDGGYICEVSLVDRPANPRTLFTMVKADDAGNPVEVAELVEHDDDTVVAKAAEILERLDELLPAAELAKYDEASDIQGAQDAIACIARLIQSEAGELANGRQEELADINILTRAVEALQWFLRREQQQAEMPDDRGAGDDETGDFDEMAGDVMKTDDTKPADEVDAAAGEVDEADEADTTKVDEADLAKVDIPAIVKAAVAEAGQAYEERFASLEAELAKALALPEPGGPVQIRTAPQQALAQARESETVRAQIADFLHKADQIGNNDPTLAEGYRVRAKVLERTLTG